MNELEVTTTVELNKQDVVTVAMAKIESHIRKRVREAKKKISELDKLIGEKQLFIETESERIIPAPMLAKRKKMERGVRDAGFKDIVYRINFEQFENSKTNRYTASIMKGTEDRISHVIVLETEVKDFNKSQSNAIDDIAKMRKQKSDLADEAVKWKSKLSDMAAVERQMRAKVVESELEKTKDGKALIAILTKDYEETINLLEM